MRFIVVSYSRRSTVVGAARCRAARCPHFAGRRRQVRLRFLPALPRAGV